MALSTIGINGTSGFGKIGQVVQGTKTNQFETTSTSYATSGLEATITPSASSSKILIMTSTSAIHTSTTSAGVSATASASGSSTTSAGSLDFISSRTCSTGTPKAFALASADLLNIFSGTSNFSSLIKKSPKSIVIFAGIK